GALAVARKGALRLAPRLAVVDEMRERQQIEDGDGARRRLGAVVILFQPQQDRGIAPGGAEPAAILVVPEARVLLRLQLARPREPRRIAAGLEQLEQSPGERGVV